MTKNQKLFLLTQLSLIIIPVFFWKYISNTEFKFSIALFLLFFFGYVFFKGFENIFRENWQKQNMYYNWLGLLLQLIILYMFYSYSIKILDIIKNI